MCNIIYCSQKNSHTIKKHIHIHSIIYIYVFSAGTALAGTVKHHAYIYI